MLARLILALLLAAFATPAAVAAPACHGETPAVTTHHADHRPAPAPQENEATAHMCIGCVPLADWLGARVAAPTIPAGPMPAIRAERMDLGQASAPALPPPRRA